MLLAALGIYGVLSYTVSQRTGEMGVRIALGATSGGILRLVVGQAMLLTGLGLLLGSLGALGLGGVLRSQRVGTRAPGLLVLAAILLGFLAVAALASYLPARRAARIDPMVALRAE